MSSKRKDGYVSICVPYVLWSLGVGMEPIWVAALIISAATGIGIGVLVLLSGLVVATAALVDGLVIVVVLVVPGSSVDDGSGGRRDGGSHCELCFAVDRGY